MGIKKNFTQAVRELTGAAKDETKRDKSIEGMRSSMAAEDTSEFIAIQNPQPAEEEPGFEEIEKRAAAAAEEYNRQQNAFDNNLTFEGQPAEQYSAEPSEPVQPAQPEYNQNSGFAQQPEYSQNAGFAQQPQYSAPSYDNSGYSAPASYTTSRYQTPVDDSETTIISKNTVIDGNVRSFANMSVDGNIKGNVETTKDIDVNGKIVGNISCNNATMRTSQIQGNIQMKGNAYMERDTLLIGDLTSSYANVNGKIRGNLDITGKAELKSDAVVFGDISASTITVNDGAIIQGYVSTTFLNKEESKNIFPESITIGE